MKKTVWEGKALEATEAKGATVLADILLEQIFGGVGPKTEVHVDGLLRSNID